MFVLLAVDHYALFGNAKLVQHTWRPGSVLSVSSVMFLPVSPSKQPPYVFVYSPAACVFR